MGQWQAQTRMRQDEIVIRLEQSQLVTQSRFVFAQRVDPPTDGRHMLTKIQIQALSKGRVDFPPPLGQDDLMVAAGPTPS